MDERGRGSSVLLLRAAVAGALAFAAAGCAGSAATSGALARRGPPSATYTLMQMNLCLSGLAGCYAKVAYPAGVDDAVARIRALHPDAVTLNEACGGDVDRIARRTGYHVRFSTVLYRGARLHCIHPGGRGLFGDAVLTAAAIDGGDSRAFRAQEGIERRRWLCVATRAGIDVCTAHLNGRVPAEVAGNDAQCAELATLLARRAARRAVIFGGDVNRRDSCAPRGLWTRTDGSAEQAPGLQQVYGSAALGAPAVQVLPAAHTDHDVLVVRAHRISAAQAGARTTAGARSPLRRP